MEVIKFLAVDLQKEFTEESGRCYVPGKSTDFIKNILIPFFKKKNIRISEIISDYRQPRPGDPRDCCIPGEIGYESIIPQKLVYGNSWVKALNSPSWTRTGIGNSSVLPSKPFPKPDKFTDWLNSSVGTYHKLKFVVLFGLTLDRCILCTAQELCFRGYDVKILTEASDTKSGSIKEKAYLLENPPLVYWAKGIKWNKLRSLL